MTAADSMWLWLPVLGLLVVVLAIVAVVQRRGVAGFHQRPDLDECLRLSQEYLNDKRFMEAMVVCKKGIKVAPEDPRGHMMLARIYGSQGKDQAAKRVLIAVLEQHPDNAEAARLLEEHERKSGRG